MKKKMLSVVLAGCLCLSMAAVVGAETDSEGLTIGYVNMDDTDEWLAFMRDEFKETAEAEGNTVKLADSKGDLQVQIEQTENFITQGVDLLVIVPVDYDGSVPCVEAANEAEIPVICLDVECNGGEYYYAGVQHKGAGLLQGEYCAENLPENAKILYMAGTPGLYHSTQRWEGFEEACLNERPDVEVLSNQTANYNRDEAMTLMEDWLQSYDHVDALICANDSMAMGALEAIKAAGRLDEFQIICGVDATDDVCNSILADEITMTCQQSTKEIVDCAMIQVNQIRNGEAVDETSIAEWHEVTKDNAQEILDQ